MQRFLLFPGKRRATKAGAAFEATRSSSSNGYASDEQLRHPLFNHRKNW